MCRVGVAFMLEQIVIANVINFFAGLCNVLSVNGKDKKQIVSIEFLSTILCVFSMFIVNSWSDVVAKIIKAIVQAFSLKDNLNNKVFYVLSFFYISICLYITYLTNDLRCLVAIIPSVLEFYALLGMSTKKYRFNILITKVFWVINNILFKLYVSIIFDVIVIVGHFMKIKKNTDK